jgi:hypothetical protein
MCISTLIVFRISRNGFSVEFKNIKGRLAARNESGAYSPSKIDCHEIASIVGNWKANAFSWRWSRPLGKLTATTMPDISP